MKKLFLALVLLFSAVMPSVSHAKEGDLTGYALAGYGFKDGLNFGVGARGVYELQGNFTIGGLFTYNFGKSEDVFGGTASVTSWFVAAEGGYNIPLQGSKAVIRPYAGLGIAGVSVKTPSYSYFGYTYGGGTASDTKFYFRPGVTGTLPIGDKFYVGADACFHVISDVSGFGLYGMFGMKF